jgi:chitinase
VSYVLSAQVPPSKILVGIPCFGLAFPGALGPGQPYMPVSTVSNQSEDRRVEYAELPRPGCVEREDQTVGGAWCLDAKSGWISHDNVVTVRMKAGYVQNMHLGGLFYQDGTGDVRGPRSLVEAGYNALHNQ